MTGVISAIAIVLSSLLLAPAGLSAQGRSETLLVLVESGPNSMDIHGVGANFRTYGASWNLYDRLLTHATKTLSDGTRSYDHAALKGELAESWQVAADGMSVTFKLRRDARFHDGTPVTARDVKWSFDRAVSVGGFPTFQMKAGALEKPEQFLVVDDQTFRVNFLRKDKWTLPDLAVPVPVVINSTLARKNATDKDPWAMDYPEYFFLWTYHGQNSLFNTSSYQNPEMDKLIEAAHQESDPKKYADTVRAFTRIALAAVPKVPLMQPSLDVAMQKNVTGYQYWFHRQLDFRTLAKP